MQESLKSQLDRLKQNQKTQPQLPYQGQSSLLFDFRNANLIEVDSIYEIGYLILFGIVSIVVSYFNKSTEFDYIVMPLLDMFKVLSVMSIFSTFYLSVQILLLQ